ncbi:MAG: hypothetical protein R3E14_04770 [Erythrobacter sp.]
MKTLISTLALTFAVMATPAAAGPLGGAGKAAGKVPERAAPGKPTTAGETTWKVEKGTRARTRVAPTRKAGASAETRAGVSPSWKIEKGERAAASGDGVDDLVVGAGSGSPRGATRGKFRQEGGTTVGTADDVAAPRDPRAESSIGRGRARSRATVATAAPDEGGGLWNAIPARGSKPAEAGTGHEEWVDIQASGQQSPAHNPRNPENVQASEAQRSQASRKAKLSRNGTTVATANEVLAPETD